MEGPPVLREVQEPEEPEAEPEAAEIPLEMLRMEMVP